MKELYEAPMVQVINMEVQASVMQASTEGLTLPGYGEGTLPE